ncbi:MAG: hypothetical protein JWN52_5277 [Actinomycetia bacterium]|nr:hypothetical protein [Actinomycetes bacterium]
MVAAGALRIGLVIVVALANWVGATAVYTFTAGTETIAHVKSCDGSRNSVCSGSWTGRRGLAESGQIFGVDRADVGRDVRVRLGPLGAIAARAWGFVFGLSFLALLGDVAIIALIVRWLRRPNGLIRTPRLR